MRSVRPDERDRQTDRQTDRHRHRHTERQRQTETETEFPSLLNLMVSVDVKHHVYLLTE